MSAYPADPDLYNQARGTMRGAAERSMGDVYWCNNANTANSSGGGVTCDAPVDTLIDAQTLCNAQTTLSTYSDMVFVGAGHAETITGAAGMTFSKPGVSYIGNGTGRLRPKITFSTATTAQMIITGQGVSFTNFVFDFTGIDAIVAAISLQAADIQFIDCDFICNSATAGVVRGLYANTSGSPADRLVITGCRFLGPAVNSGTTTTAQVDIEYGVDYLIQGNYFSGKMTQAVLNATTVLRGNIDTNRFVISTGTVAITMAAGSTPLISGNRFNVPSGTAPVVAAAGFVVGNAYSAAAGVTAGAALTW